MEEYLTEKTDLSLLEQYGQVTQDISLLQQVYFSAVDNDSAPPGLLPTVLRSITRAEQEAAFIKHKYECEGQR